MMSAILSLIMLAIQSTEALEQMDGASMSFFIYYLLLSMPTVLAVVFALVFPIGIFWTISYLRDDGEILAMQTVGVKEITILSWIFECGLLAFLSVWIITSVIEPFCINQMTKAVTSYSRNHFFSMLKPKTFNVQGGNVVYANEVDPNTHKLKNVFILNSQENTWFMLNSSLLEENHNGSVTLHKGETLKYNIENEAITNSEFSTFDALTSDPVNLFDVKIKSQKYVGKSFLQLWHERNIGKSLSRIVWMLGLPSIAFFMTIMAANSMFVPPRVITNSGISKFSLAMLLNISVLIFFQRQAQNGMFNHMPQLAIVLPSLIMFVIVFFMGQFRHFNIK